MSLHLHTVFFQPSGVPMISFLSLAIIARSDLQRYYWRDVADFGSNNAWQESGHYWRAGETNLLFISSVEATSAFFQRRTDWFWTDAVLTGTVQPSHYTPGGFFKTRTGHKCQIHLPDILMDLIVEGWSEGGRLILSKQHDILHQHAKKNIFHPAHLDLTALLHLPLHGKNGLGCKWLVHVKFFLHSF